MSSQNKPNVVTTRWWWVRHAPVRSDGGNIYGQTDIACDTSDCEVFFAVAKVLPRNAVWIASNLRRTHQTAEAIWAAGFPRPVAMSKEAAFAEQNLGEWQGMNRAAFLASRPIGSHWFADINEPAPGGESFMDLYRRTTSAIERYSLEHAGKDVIAVAHIFARVFQTVAFDCASGAPIEVHETLAAGCRFVDIGEPVAADWSRSEKCGAVHSLPFAEILFGESGLLRHRNRPWKARCPNRFRGLMRAPQIARDPDRVARQNLCHRKKHLAIRSVAGDIGLAVNVAAVAAHRCMTHPPPSRRDDVWFVLAGHLDALPFCMLSLYVRPNAVSRDFGVSNLV